MLLAAVGNCRCRILPVGARAYNRAESILPRRAMLQLQSTAGILGLLALAWALGENRRAVSWRRVGASLALTLALALLLFKIPQLEAAFAAVNRGVDAIAAATRAGTAFVFGYVGGGPLPFEPKAPGLDF